MRADKNIELKIKKNEDGFTYVFDSKDEVRYVSVFRTYIWQIFPSVCGSLLCIPFGLMLGWPSPTYPKLLQNETSPIPISMDQSAMIAGALMIGNSLGTPFSASYGLGSKYGMILGMTGMSLGWIMMWQAKNIYWLLASRIMLGTGHGYGMGQLKNYIKEMCEENLTTNLIKAINLYAIFGIFLCAVIGTFFDFRQLSIIALIISVIILFLLIFLPSTPNELVKAEKLKDAKKLIIFLNPNANVKEKIQKIKQDFENNEENLGLCDILKDPKLRKKSVIFANLVICAQFTGLPSTIVYNQILFTVSKVPYPEYCAILYAFIFFLINIYGIFYSSNYNKKYLLLFSSISVSVICVVKVAVIYYNVNELFWNYTSVIVMIVFLTVHTIGLGTIPPTYINEFFPKNCRTTITHFFIITFSISALLITKIFQVLLDRFNLYIPFILYFCISSVTVFFILIFVPSHEEQKNENNSVADRPQRNGIC